MSRRRKATKRAILPDPLHGSPLISSLVNAVMFSGKKITRPKNRLQVDRKNGRESW